MNQAMRKRVITAAAVALLVVAVAGNEWLLVATFSPDRPIKPAERAAIRIAQAIVAGIGLLLLALRKRLARPPGTIRRVIGYCLIVLAASGLLSEAALRIFDPIGIAYYWEARRYFRNMTPDRRFAYIHKGGYIDRLQGADVVINRHGLRGPELRPQKAPGTSRLLVLGDSVVFGWGVMQDKILSARLQEILSEKHRPWEVLAAGVGSWNTRTENEFLKAKADELGIDAVVLVVCPNDVEPKPEGFTHLSKDDLFGGARHQPESPGPLGAGWRLATKFSYLLQSIQWLREKGSIPRFQAGLCREDSPARQDARHALEDMIAYTRGRNMELLVFLYGREPEEYISMYQGVLKANDVPGFLFPAELYEKRNRNSMVDPHPNAEGHRIMAGAVYRAMESTVFSRRAP